MREIKFRGKRVDNGEWAVGNLCEVDGKYAYINSNGKHLVCDPATIGQYLGRDDKNGVEIYEGSLYKQRCYNERPPSKRRKGSPEYVEVVGVVKYGHNGFYVSYGKLPYPYTQTRLADVDGFSLPTSLGFEFQDDIRGYVVGDIYDNPELIKQGVIKVEDGK